MPRSAIPSPLLGSHTLSTWRQSLYASSVPQPPQSSRQSVYALSVPSSTHASSKARAFERRAAEIPHYEHILHLNRLFRHLQLYGGEEESTAQQGACSTNYDPRTRHSLFARVALLAILLCFYPIPGSSETLLDLLAQCRQALRKLLLLSLGSRVLHATPVVDRYSRVVS